MVKQQHPPASPASGKPSGLRGHTAWTESQRAARPARRGSRRFSPAKVLSNVAGAQIPQSPATQLHSYRKADGDVQSAQRKTDRGEPAARDNSRCNCAANGANCY